MLQYGALFPLPEHSKLRSKKIEEWKAAFWPNPSDRQVPAQGEPEASAGQAQCSQIGGWKLGNFDPVGTIGSSSQSMSVAYFTVGNQCNLKYPI